MRLIDAFVDVLSHVLKTVEAIRDGAQPDYDEVRVGIAQRLAEKAGTYSSGGYTLEQYDSAKFAVVCFIDEALLLSPWPHRHQWARELLQKLHFGTVNGGREFFEHLDGLNPFVPGERDVREVYFYCLSLGFSGQYYQPGDRAKLDELRKATYRVLSSSEDDGDLRDVVLFPEAKAGMTEEHDVVVRRRWTPVYYGVPLLLLLCAFLYFRADIANAAEYLVSVI